MLQEFCPLGLSPPGSLQFPVPCRPLRPFQWPSLSGRLSFTLSESPCSAAEYKARRFRVNDQFCPARTLVTSVARSGQNCICFDFILWLSVLGSTSGGVHQALVQGGIAHPKDALTILRVPSAPASALTGSLRHSPCFHLWTLWTPLVTLRPLLLPPDVVDVCGREPQDGQSGGSS